MEAQERQFVLENLNASRDRILGLVEGLSPEQWRFRTDEGRWSIGECLEHVIRVENRIFGLIGNALKDGTPQPEKQLSPAERKEKDVRAAKLVVDRSTARQAPEPVRPTAQWTDGNELVAEFRETRARSRQFAETTQGDLRSYFNLHGALGELDCYQWLIVLSLHGARHAEQMEEVKASPGFPAATAASQGRT